MVDDVRGDPLSTTIYRSTAGAGVLRVRNEQALDAWPVPATRQLLPTALGETFVLSAGPEQAPPLVLLHGSSGNALSWRDAMPHWARRYRVHAVDMVGEPGLSAPTRPLLESGALIDWLGEVLDQLGSTRVALLGESLGGWLAAGYAARRPERVSALALLAPGGIGSANGLSILTALTLGAVAGRRRSMRWLLGVDDVPEEALLVQQHFRPRMEPLPIHDDATFRKLTMPTLVVLGEKDRLFHSAETAHRIAAAVPHAQTVVVPNGGHLLARPVTEVLEFLDGHPAD